MNYIKNLTNRVGVTGIALIAAMPVQSKTINPFDALQIHFKHIK